MQQIRTAVYSTGRNIIVIDSYWTKQHFQQNWSPIWPHSTKRISKLTPVLKLDLTKLPKMHHTSSLSENQNEKRNRILTCSTDRLYFVYLKETTLLWRVLLYSSTSPYWFLMCPACRWLSSSRLVSSSIRRMSAIVKPYHWSIQQKTWRWKFKNSFLSAYRNFPIIMNQEAREEKKGTLAKDCTKSLSPVAHVCIVTGWSVRHLGKRPGSAHLATS